jgi:glycosyltransferase involved in cell wall biosynthesis
MFTNGYCHYLHVDKLGPDEPWRVESIDGIRVVWLKTHHYQGNGAGRGLNMLTNVIASLRASRALPDHPDIVIGPSVPTLTGWAGYQLARRYRVPFIYEVRDVWPDALVDIGGLSRHSPVYYIFRFIEKLLYRRSQRISSVLPFLQEHVAASGGDRARVVCIPNGVDIGAFAHDPDYDGGKDRQLVVMYVGGFGLDHDVPTIIRAAKILQEEGDSTFRFVIIGGGVRKPECEAEAGSYALRNLEFRAPVPKSELPRVQREADILVAAITDSPSYRFGLNLNKMCSYFASSRPVLLSGNPPNDSVRDAGAGVSVAAQDEGAMVAGLRTLASMGPAARVELGVRGRRYAETMLSMDVLGKRMEDMLKASIAEYGERGRPDS